jgi:putative membrane protein
MKKITCLGKPVFSVLMGLLTAGATALAADVSSSDKSFLQSAYKDGLAEVKLGELGESKTANPEIKSFAGQMVTDHGKANSELKALADSKKVEVASEPSLISKGKNKMLDAKSGADFDKAFADAMVSDHKDAVKAFEKAANEATDPEVKAFASKTLPTLKHHLSMAEALQQKFGK